ncbi:MAG: 3-hydroxyacyl-CoA dehydrogenase NAD-binding domain-containing protein [Planctomycetota bacterium]|nr:3-hydroxyacyl-CoA dehydrogenase NAD-binding domain-containing protein [Planctomycetota bacterium]
MDSFRITTASDGIATVWFDVPGKSVNTLGAHTLAELGEVISNLEHSRPKAVIFASAKPRNFIAGADLFEIREMDHAAVEKFLHDGQSTFDRIENLGVPTVAAINGDCLGGGLEMALACTYRIAADDTSIKIGLPEVKLGIIPGFGGTVRLTRLLGLPAALPLLIAGKTLPPRKARKAGYVDEVVRPEALLDAARRWVRGSSPAHRPKLASRLASSIPLLRTKILQKAQAETMRRTFGNYPAALKVIEVAGEGLKSGPAKGYAAERSGLLELVNTPACRNLLRLFFLRQGAKRAATANLTAAPRTVEYAAVVGGGTMGAGIVHELILAGIKVRLIEVNDNAVSAALSRISKMLEQDVRDGRLDALAAKHTFNRVVPTTHWDGLGICDFAIEAVLENMEMKRDVFRRLDKLMPAHAVLASNTSSLSITQMARATTAPHRVIGLHFFNPVPKMPLVEIIRTDDSDHPSLATAIALAARLGKTPVLVRDAPGFLVNRVLIPYLAEAALMAREDHDIQAIDGAMKRFGWPMGPFELLDEIGLDVGSEVLKSLAARDPRYAEIPAWMSPMIGRGWLGKKTGRGFYMHDPAAKRDAEPVLNDELALVLHPGSPTKPNPLLSELDVQARLMEPMVREAKRAMEEGIVDSPDAIDLATVMGLGFPPFRGGLAKYAGLAMPSRSKAESIPASPEIAASQLHSSHA